MKTFDYDTLTEGDYGLEGTVPFYTLGTVPLLIEATSAASMADAQRAALNEFLNWDAALYRAMEQPIFDYYRAMYDEYGEEEHLPVLASPADVWAYVSPSVVIVPNYGDENARYISVECNCVWELEHGLEIDVKNGSQVVYVGAFEGGGYRNDGRAADGSPSIGNYVR